MNDIQPLHKTRLFGHIKPLQIILVVLVLLLLAGLGAGGWYFYTYRMNPKSVAQKNQEEAKALAQEVGRYMLLPADELPTIATVTDVSKLSGQDFFKFAQNGDKVLIFTKAKMAILYSPRVHKVLNVGPVNVGAAPNQAPQAKIAILNGTTVDGLAAKEQTTLQSAFPGASIVKTGTANSTDYAKTIIVVFNPLAKNAGQALSTYYNNAIITNLPSTENPQDGVDILIILGKDRSSAVTTPAPSQIQKTNTTPVPTDVKQ